MVPIFTTTPEKFTKWSLQNLFRSCKDPCATTVCRACETRFDPSLSCVYCPYGQKSIEKKKYIDCIKEFGRCVKKGIHGKGQEFSNMVNISLVCFCIHCDDSCLIIKIFFPISSKISETFQTLFCSM